MASMINGGRSLMLAAVLGFALAGCQSGDTGNVLGVDGSGQKTAPEGKILASELLAYCPKVSLREGTAFFNTYAKGGEDDKSKIIYQASIADVTRACSRADGSMTINVAVAGKVVPGPLGTSGTVTMPIRVVVMRGEEVLYSQLHKHPVEVNAGGATQFVFTDAPVIPNPSARDLQVFAGYDEGPPKKPKAESDAF